MDDVYMRRRAGARRDVRLDSCQPSSTEVPMRRIGLAVVRALGNHDSVVLLRVDHAGGRAAE